MSELYPSIEEDQPKQPAPDSKGEASVPTYTTDPGPIDKRKCHDILFLILFILMWIGMLAIGGFAIKKGNLSRLKYGNDSSGNLCGVVNENGVDLTDAPFQYILYPWDISSYRKCVRACPTENFQYVCKYQIEVPQNAIDFAIRFSEKNCTFSYKSKSVLNRCLPDMDGLFEMVKRWNNQSATVNSTDAASNIINIDKALLGSTDIIYQVFQDLYSSWKTILICSFVAAGISVFWLYLLQWFSGFVIFITIFAVNIASVGFTAFIWWTWWSVTRQSDTSKLVNDYFPSPSSNEKTIFVIAVISSVISVVLLLLVIALRRRIKLAVLLIEETSKAVRAVPAVIILPILKYVLIFGLIAWTLYIWIFNFSWLMNLKSRLLATSGSVIVSQIVTSVQNKTSISFEPDRALQGLSLYYLFGFFWSFNWIIAVTQCTIAGTIATWYWTRDKQSLPRMPLLKAFRRTLLYHSGSLAFGALIIASVQFLRTILMGIQYYLKKYRSSTTVQCFLSCLQCCFACVESTLKFINKNAYIEIAIYGYSFCKASRTAFALIVRNAVRLWVIDNIGDFLFFLGKFMIMMSTCMVGLALLQNSDSGSFWAVTLIFIAWIAYVIASSFVAVFSMSLNTIVLCFCEDSERNDGSAEKPYFMTDSLKKFMSKPKKDVPKMIEKSEAP